MVVFSLLLAAACSNERRAAVSMTFVDENCVKRRFTQIDGQGVTVSTYEADGGLTPVAHFETWAQADNAYPVPTKPTNCPEGLKVTLDDLKSHRPFPVDVPDAGADIGNDAGSQPNR
jgi:hypothetical protein